MVASGPTPLIVGSVLSSTVIVCAAVVVLPQASVAVHVLLTLYSVAHAPFVVISAEVNVVLPQPSLAVGELNVGVAGH